MYTRMRNCLLIAGLAVVALGGPDASAAAKRCNRTHGKELAHSTIVKVYKVRVGSSYRFFGCARPSGPVVPLTQPFKGNAVKLVAAKGAYVAFTRTIRGRDTIATVDARTGRKRRGLYPPGEIEFDVDPRTPQIAAARVNSSGELVVSYVGLGAGDTRDSTIYVYAFDRTYHQQLLDSGPSSKLIARSIKLRGRDVSWTHDGATRTARIGEVSLSVTSGGGLTEGTVTTVPEGGIACHVGPLGLAGTCVGSFEPNTPVQIVATGTASATVTIRGACSAVHAPVAGQATSVATCMVFPDRAKSVEVTFS